MSESLSSRAAVVLAVAGAAARYPSEMSLSALSARDGLHPRISQEKPWLVLSVRSNARARNLSNLPFENHWLTYDKWHRAYDHVMVRGVRGRHLERRFLPERAIIIGNTWSILQDPVEYPEPDQFKPDTCPGRYFSDASLYIAVASILSAFTIEAPLDAQGKRVQAFKRNIKPRSKQMEELLHDIEV
ncbi:hypothetical protein C8R44DRAFT_979868 [Mycena epipterygia]|nr:hypothetical protein C8R44DRAFT_979868 [Mycena epipterygia]